MLILCTFTDAHVKEFEHIRIPKPSPGPSRFIPASIITPIDTQDPLISRIFQDVSYT